MPQLDEDGSTCAKNSTRMKAAVSDGMTFSIPTQDVLLLAKRCNMDARSLVRNLDTSKQISALQMIATSTRFVKIAFLNSSVSATSTTPAMGKHARLTSLLTSALMAVILVEPMPSASIHEIATSVNAKKDSSKTRRSSAAMTRIYSENLVQF